MSDFPNGRKMADAINRAAQKAAGGKGTVDVKRNVDQSRTALSSSKAAPACWRRSRTAVRPETSI